MNIESSPVEPGARTLNVNYTCEMAQDLMSFHGIAPSGGVLANKWLRWMRWPFEWLHIEIYSRTHPPKWIADALEWLVGRSLEQELIGIIAADIREAIDKEILKTLGIKQ